jgi:hypothetical protein
MLFLAAAVAAAGWVYEAAGLPATAILHICRCSAVCLHLEQQAVWRIHPHQSCTDAHPKMADQQSGAFAWRLRGSEGFCKLYTSPPQQLCIPDAAVDHPTGGYVHWHCLLPPCYLDFAKGILLLSLAEEVIHWWLLDHSKHSCLLQDVCRPAGLAWLLLLLLSASWLGSTAQQQRRDIVRANARKC